MLGLHARTSHAVPITIDGSVGEGGGQILRTALGLSLVSGRPFRMENIRKKRSRAGLLRQHATAVAAAAAIGDARVVGGEVGSETLGFRPGAIAHGRFAFAVGTAGSTTLVLHAVLPALLVTEGESELVLEGGTDASSAPPFDHLDAVYVPLLRSLGVDAGATLGRRGFYPAGGGRFTFRVRGGELEPFELETRGELLGIDVVARLGGGLARRIAEKELAIVGERLGLARAAMRVEDVDSLGPGNTLSATLRFEHATEVFTSFGAKNASSEHVAKELAADVQEFLAYDVPVSEHTADQLVLLLALAGGGSFVTVPPTEHTRTQAALIPAFLDVDVRIEPHERGTRISVERRG